MILSLMFVIFTKAFIKTPGEFFPEKKRNTCARAYTHARTHLTGFRLVVTVPSNHRAL